MLCLYVMKIKTISRQRRAVERRCLMLSVRQEKTLEAAVEHMLDLIARFFQESCLASLVSFRLNQTSRYSYTQLKRISNGSDAFYFTRTPVSAAKDGLGPPVR